jgi:small subunit ribosomal protein S16
MLRIRLSRTGKKRQPSYRVVVADIESKRDGRVVERIGHYNPLTDPAEYQIDESRALHWLSVGAQPSDAVKRLLEKQGTYDRLARLHKGEPIEALVAEYKGEPLQAEKAGIAATVSSAVSAVAEAVEEIVEEVVAAVEEEE